MSSCVVVNRFGGQAVGRGGGSEEWMGEGGGGGRRGEGEQEGQEEKEEGEEGEGVRMRMRVASVSWVNRAAQ